jgi:hypothetical protein
MYGRDVIVILLNTAADLHGRTIKLRSSNGTHFETAIEPLLWASLHVGFDKF